MRTTLRWLMAIALLCAVAVAGCGGDDDEAESESTADGGDDGDDGDGGGVPGSPINIPAFQGGPLEDVLPEIERQITDLCGGELCLVLDVEMSDDDATECDFVETDPPAGSQVERGGTLVVIAGTHPCEEDQPDDGDDGDDDEPPDDDNGNTDDGTDDQPADDDTDDTPVTEATP